MHVGTFYQFATIADLHSAQEEIAQLCEQQELVGTILLAPEGINATLAHRSRECVERTFTAIEDLLRLQPIRTNWSTAASDNPVFHRLRVRLRSEIVNFGVPVRSNVEPNRVEGDAWNALLSDPSTVAVDVRNTYETEIGAFPDAVEAKTEHFRDFPQFVQANMQDKKSSPIAMYCTGGIRCEKAARWMLANGFENVSLLDRGILGYFDDDAKKDDLWKGECFVFDQRVSVTRELVQGTKQQCFACRRPLDKRDLASPHFEHGVSCPKCWDKTSATKKTGFKERVHQEALAKARNSAHIGLRQQRRTKAVDVP